MRAKFINRVLRIASYGLVVTVCLLFVAGGVLDSRKPGDLDLYAQKKNMDLGSAVGSLEILVGFFGFISVALFYWARKSAAVVKQARSAEKEARWLASLNAQELEARVQQEKRLLEEEWERERKADVDEREQWKVEKAREMYIQIIGQMISGELRPDMKNPPPWRGGDFPR